MELRRNFRDLDVFQRDEGFNARRMFTSRRSLLYFCTIIVPATLFPPGLIQICLLLVAIYFCRTYYRARYGPRVAPQILVRFHRRINDYDTGTFKVKFKFLKTHAHAVMSCLLGFNPPNISCDNRSVCHYEEAFLIMLFRMARPRTLVEASEEFGIDHSQICRIFNTIMQLVVQRNHILIFDNIAYFVPRFPIYNQALRAKITSLNLILPAAALDTALFTDGTSKEILRPGENQARVYNGHHHVHCLQFQITMGLCGMIVDFFGPIAGARHDEYVNRVSQFNQRLATAQNGQAQQYSDYRDKGYVARSHGHVAFKGRNLPHALIDSNATMSPQRVGVEWLFAKIDACCTFILAPRIHNIQNSAVGTVYTLAAILTNCHTCATGGSQQSIYWNVSPPTLGHYFNRPDILV